MKRLFLLALAAFPAVAQEAPQAASIRVRGDAFFVLGSDYPVRITRDSATAPWLRVDSVDEAQLAPRTISIHAAAATTVGERSAAIRIDVATGRGREEIRLGVEACSLDCTVSLGARAGGGVGLADPRAEVRTSITPSGNLLLEIVDREREQRDVEAALLRARERASRTTPSEPRFALALAWMCLEYPCGSSTAADIADAGKGLDALTAVSYERYTFRDGVFAQHPVGDPGTWALGVGLELWPMLTGGSEPSAAAVERMWQSRAATAEALLAEARTRGYAGYCLDVEGHADAATTSTFLALVSYLADRLHGEGRRLMVATATWSTIAPFAGLMQTSADYLVSMDPYTSLWRSYVPANYATVEPARLVWGFTWDRMPRESQLAMWEWMEASGYNAGVAGAAAWRTPLAPPHPGNDIDYYDAFRVFYPARPR